MLVQPLIFGIGGPEIIFIAFIILLFFGGKKIPEIMKGLGKGVKSFKDGINGVNEASDESSQKTEEKKEDTPKQ